MIKFYKVSFVLFSLFVILNLALLIFSVGITTSFLSVVVAYIVIFGYYQHVLTSRKISVFFTLIFTVLCFYYITGGDLGNITQSFITLTVYVVLVLPFPIMAISLAWRKSKSVGWVIFR